MYHIDGSDYLNTPYYQKIGSVCPECLQRIPAEIYEEENGVLKRMVMLIHLIVKRQIQEVALIIVDCVQNTYQLVLYH